MRWWRVPLGVICLTSGYTAEAQSEDPLRFLHWTTGDIIAVPQGTLKLQTGLTLGVATGGILAVSHFDRRFSREAEDFANRTPRRMRRILHEAGNANIIRPMAAVLFVGSLTSGNVVFQDAAFTSLEAIVLANLLTNGLKLVVGRARPHDDLGPNSLKPFSGDRSFPSGHATTVFAFTTPWLLYYPGIVSGGLFALGIGTATVRMADRYHWFSDVLGGALIGFGTGYLLSRRHQRLALGANLGISMRGISLTWKI